MSEISKRIMDLIEKKNISYGELSKITLISKSALQRYATGETEKIPLDRLEKIACALGVTAACLMGWKEETASPQIPPNAVHALPATHFAPVLGSVRAGYGGLAVQEIVGENVLPPEYVDDGESYFWLVVEGSSMEPKLENGDYVLVRSQQSVDSGSVAVVTVDDEEGVVKKVCYGDNWIELRSFNERYATRRFEGEEVLRINVMGKVVKSEHKW